MRVFRPILLLMLVLPVGPVGFAVAQQKGALEISGRVRIEGKTEKIVRKRFYLFRGGLTANKPLLDKIKASEPVSRDCFYCRMKASPEYIAWLKSEDCESPYCRAISADDAAEVPEFKAAYQKGLRQYRNKTAVAQDWITVNLPPSLRDGFYLQRKSLVDSFLAIHKPVQSSMTDSVSVRSMFIDILLNTTGDASETFTISNLVPVEVGGKGYVWACEVDLGPDKKVTLPLKVPDPGKTIKDCEVIVRDLPVCNAGVCASK